MDALASMAMFVRVVESGSFSAAADASGVSPTMAGKHIRAIEQRLGARLLHRTTRRQQLTEVGRLYYERCKQVLADVELAEASASELQATPRGRLRLTAPMSFGSRRLTPALTDYLQRYPDVSVDLTLDNRVVDVVGEGYELAIRIGAIDDPQLVARPLLPYRMLLVASPGYLARHGTPQHPRDLSTHVCLGLSNWRRRDQWRLTGADGEICDVPVHGRLSVDHGDALRVAALHDAGIVLQPEVLLADDLEAGRLESVLPGWAPPATPMHLLYAPDRRPTAKLRSMIDFLLERFGARSEQSHAE
ncbi:LysR family transcriptional regulator [Dyella solisilvae]|uniref:LysR family transcriptional regulator n=1 Tax=Dyella solisilvae TaxID=1920168 RepID=A0A370KEI9_9GAMM|nr:LysR family transcriptional regulator [Dyella solisilvae]RDJ00521.1 LysR family transcriptional regulator [Dyella solisilvae]